MGLLQSQIIQSYRNLKIFKDHNSNLYGICSHSSKNPIYMTIVKPKMTKVQAEMMKSWLDQGHKLSWCLKELGIE